MVKSAELVFGNCQQANKLDFFLASASNKTLRLGGTIQTHNVWRVEQSGPSQWMLLKTGSSDILFCYAYSEIFLEMLDPSRFIT